MATSQWPVGNDFVAVAVDSEVLIWGGTQEDRGEFQHLPRNLIYFYAPSSNTWRRISATGDIPMHPIHSASVIYDALLYIFGGARRDKSFETTNDVFTLNMTTGVFKLLTISGIRPSPRHSLEGWSHQNKLYFFGGYDWNQRGDNQFVPPSKTSETDNLLFSFSPDSNSFSAIETSGPRPGPRSTYGMARINDSIFISSGYKSYDDMFELDMMKFSWKQHKGSGFSIYDHSLTRISKNRLLLIGGKTSNKVWVFDASNFSWNETSPLPKDIYGEYLRSHRAVALRQGTGLSIICFGGVTSARKEPSQMLVFDIE